MPNPFKTAYQVTQPFGCTGFPAEPAYGDCKHFHRGIDLVASPSNAPIYSICSGYVYNARTDSDGAKYVIVLGDDEHWYCYWHLSEIAVSPRQRVSIGTKLGNQGSTGHSTGAHLHLEIHQPGTWLGLLKMTPIDPTPYLADPGGGASMSNSVWDYLKNPDKHAEKMWIWVLAEAFQRVEFGKYPDAAADGHVGAILGGASRGELAATFARDGGWLTADEAAKLRIERDKLAGSLQNADNLNEQLMKENEAALKSAQSARDVANELATKLQTALTNLEACQTAAQEQSKTDCQMEVNQALDAQLQALTTNPWVVVRPWLVNRWAEAVRVFSRSKGGDR